MKRKLFFIAILCMGTLVNYAQSFRMGVTGGANFSTFSAAGDLYDNSAILTGFTGGLSLQYHVSESWGLVSGIAYEQKGFSSKTGLSGEDYTVKGHFNYLTVPLMIQGKLPVKGKTSIYGLAGGYIGFNTHSDDEWEVEQTETVFPGKPDIASTDGGLTFGGGVEIPVSEHLLQIGFRYSLGLAEVIASMPDDRNKTVQL
ncbi:MAG: PorT family protein, partial [Bacteroidales bacterium]|nr:PorT family protein [Bacteroidales bacterium]